MSTRSGKRIHSSPQHESAGDPEILHNKIKTRSKHNKGCEEEHFTEKKRKHYVKYPSEETSGDSESNLKSNKPLRKSRRNTLKDRNVHINESEVNEEKHIERHTRRTKRNEKLDDDLSNQDENNHEKKDKKKSKKKKRVLVSNENKVHSDQEDNNMAVSKKKQKNKRKNKRKSGSIIVEDINNTSEQCKALNASKMSVDSFHSAAGSPIANEDGFKELNLSNDKSTPKNKKENGDLCVKRVKPNNNNSSSKKKSKNDCNKLKTCSTFSNFEVNEDTAIEKQDDNQSGVVNTIFKKQKDKFVQDRSLILAERTPIKRKSGIHNVTIDKMGDFSEASPSQKVKNSNEKKKNLSNKSIELCDTMHSTHEQTTHETEANLNSTFDKTDTAFHRLTKLDTTFEKNNKTNTTGTVNTTFDKPSKLDTTFDKTEKTNTTIDTGDKTNTTFDNTEKVNTTFDKTEKVNTTFDKTERNNTTFDKIDTDTAKSRSDRMSEANEETHNSTLNEISQVNAKTIEIHETTKNYVNTTFDKISNDTSNNSLLSSDTSKRSHISLTSDESHSENILNNTPHLVESSMEEVHNDSNSTNSPVSSHLHSKPPATPLKREGTFTKDSSETSIMPTVKTSIDKTPTRRKSLPSPGCTPFPLTKSLSNDKSVSNLTHSVEKSRRSSLAEALPRTTKVMFCSPSNNPAVVSQMKRKVIKSSLKGSNKSFIFEDSGRVAGRKRSQPQAAAEPRAKRSRLLAERSPAPPPRARARTVSASAKIPDSCTPTTKVDSPTKTKETKLMRTKLPNFAALHQKQFDRMESLDECQERKARRAKQLLTPNGAIAFLERISPKEQAPKQPEPNQVKNSETPAKSKPAPTNPGYSRFGFKLNMDSNPFSFTAKSTDIKPKVQPKLKRQVTMPSLTGTTLSHKEVAKQAIMREKSFAGKRAEDRKETRTVIKGVRTNRRFDLQMKMRNING